MRCCRARRLTHDEDGAAGFVRDAFADAAKRCKAVEAAAAENQQISILRGGDEIIRRLALVELEILDRAELPRGRAASRLSRPESERGHRTASPERRRLPWPQWRRATRPYRPQLIAASAPAPPSGARSAPSTAPRVAGASRPSRARFPSPDSDRGCRPRPALRRGARSPPEDTGVGRP
jgi:hypothetical protein